MATEKIEEKLFQTTTESRSKTRLLTTFGRGFVVCSRASSRLLSSALSLPLSPSFSPRSLLLSRALELAKVHDMTRDKTTHNSNDQQLATRL